MSLSLFTSFASRERNCILLADRGGREFQCLASVPFEFCIMYLCYLYICVYSCFFFFKAAVFEQQFSFVSYPIASHHGSGGTVHSVGTRHALIMDEVDGMAGNEDRRNSGNERSSFCSGTVNF